MEEVKENPSKVLFRVQSGIFYAFFWHTTLEALKQSLKACMLNFLTLPNWWLKTDEPQKVIPFFAVSFHILQSDRGFVCEPTLLQNVLSAAWIFFSFPDHSSSIAWGCYCNSNLYSFVSVTVCSLFQSETWWWWTIENRSSHFRFIVGFFCLHYDFY